MMMRSQEAFKIEIQSCDDNKKNPPVCPICTLHEQGDSDDDDDEDYNELLKIVIQSCENHLSAVSVLPINREVVTTMMMMLINMCDENK